MEHRFSSHDRSNSHEGGGRAARAFLRIAGARTMRVINANARGGRVDLVFDGRSPDEVLTPSPRSRAKAIRRGARAISPGGACDSAPARPALDDARTSGRTTAKPHRFRLDSCTKFSNPPHTLEEHDCSTLRPRGAIDRDDARAIGALDRRRRRRRPQDVVRTMMKIIRVAARARSRDAGARAGGDARRRARAARRISDTISQPKRYARGDGGARRRSDARSIEE